MRPQITPLKDFSEKIPKQRPVNIPNRAAIQIYRFGRKKDTTIVTMEKKKPNTGKKAMRASIK
jgi:hypothetical protein